MSTQSDFIRENILLDMSDGVITIGFDGILTSVNPAAGRILAAEPTELIGQPFALCFFDRPENDAFNQTILDAVYNPDASHRNVVPYSTGTVTRQLHVTTSYLRKDGEKLGVIAVLSDISELTELRDAVKAMERIKMLNKQLELRNKLISETFGRYLSDEIVSQLLDTPDGLMLGGKKRELTILMSDLRGFTAMSEQMNAQELITMLNHYLAVMTDIIQAYGGTIIEFLGDGIFVVFGAPAPSETHAADATACAVAMEQAMEELNDWNAQRGYPQLEMGIGVNTGDVIVGNIGSEKRTKYGVVGRNVNLCGRIESYTVGGQVFIAPYTRSLIAAPLEVVQELEILPKGVAVPITISRVVSVGAPYNVRCKSGETLPDSLTAPMEISFADIEGKHVSAVWDKGQLTALSHDGALLESETPLSPYANLKLLLPCGEALCKVMRTEGKGWLLRFTSRPDGFEVWRSAVQQAK
ncbi:MAG: adenylate/guanylate cyclase domain-containing protein [Oscillospiraceae bacterium]